MSKLNKGQFYTLEQLMQMFNLSESQAAVSVAMMQRDGVMGEYMKGEGYPVLY